MGDIVRIGIFRACAARIRLHAGTERRSESAGQSLLFLHAYVDLISTLF